MYLVYLHFLLGLFKFQGRWAVLIHVVQLNSVITMQYSSWFEYILIVNLYIHVFQSRKCE